MVDERCKMILGDALVVLPTLAAASVDIIAADPPYFKVKDLAWDHQWATAADYLAWIGKLCEEWRRVMKPNGSLYVFASPQMAARVEVEIAGRFNVLNQIVWKKVDAGGNGKWKQQCKEECRGWFPQTERIIFAEQYGADHSADDASGYTTQCEFAKSSIIGVYLRAEFKRANVTQREIAALFPSVSGGMTGCVSNWLLGYNMPTAEQYATMRTFLNDRNGCTEYLRREYEDLRREYEDLRRPFFVTDSVPYTDVWDFVTVQAGRGKHPCEKPSSLLRHVVTTSTRPDAVVLDPFAGSGVLGEVCKDLGRRYIGIEKDERWHRRALQRIEAHVPLFVQPDGVAVQTLPSSLFDEDNTDA